MPDATAQLFELPLEPPQLSLEPELPHPSLEPELQLSEPVLESPEHPLEPSLLLHPSELVLVLEPDPEPQVSPEVDVSPEQLSGCEA